jgi:hypothetical protein
MKDNGNGYHILHITEPAKPAFENQRPREPERGQGNETEMAYVSFV